MTGRVDPFVGLAPYGEQDAEWFFGREREVELIVANLRAARLTLLYGTSGVGKSSVLLAGALPRLRAIQDADREDALTLAAHGGASLAERPSLAIAIVRDWAHEPLVRLAAAVHGAVVDATGDEAIEPWDGGEPFAAWLRDQAREVRTLLVVLDQFEEYFMYHPDEDGPATLAGELPSLLGDIDLRVNFLLGMREDALFRLDRFKGLIPDLFGNYLRLDYLERNAARGAIRKPVDHFNATVRAGRPPVEVDGAVVEAVLDGVRAGRLALHGAADPGPAEVACTRVETPYLQLVMRRLWAAGTADGGLAVTMRTLEGLGGAAAIVSNHLGQAMDELSDDDQAVAADVFRYLVSSSRTKIAHAAEDLAGFSGRPEEDVRRVLQELADSDRRVLRAVPGTSKGDPVRYELYHDVLAEAVHEWATRNQQRRSRLEARRTRRRRWRKRILIGLAWVACAALAVVYVPRLFDDGEHVTTPIAQKLADLATISLEPDPEHSVLLAREAYARAPGLPDAEAALRSAVTASRVRAAYLGGEPRPCGAACARMGPRGKPKPVAVSMYAARSDRYYDDVGYSSGQMDGGRWMAVAPSGRTVAVIRKGSVELWTPRRENRPVRELAGASDVEKVAFIGTHGRLLLVTDKDAVLVADARDVTPVAKRATLTAASAGGRYVATAHAEGVVRVLDLKTGETTRLQLGRRVTSLAFNPSDARQLAAGVRDADGNGVRLMDWPSGGGTRLKAGPRWLGDAEARFNGDGRQILITTGARRAQVLDVDTGERIEGAAAQLGSAAGVRWLGPWVGGTTGNLVKLAGARVLGGNEFAVRSMAASRDGALIATGADDGSVRVWDSDTGNQMLELRAGDAAVTSLAFAPSGRLLVTGDKEHAVRIWAVSTGRALPDGFDADAEFKSDGSLTGVGYDGRVASWDPSGDRKPKKQGRLESVGYHTELAPEGDTVASLEWRGRGRLTVASIDGRERRALNAESFALSDDGTRVLLLGTRRPRLVDPARKAATVRFGRFPSPVYVGALSRDGSEVLLGKRIFDADSPKQSVTLKGRVGYGGAFSPDGTRLVTTGREARVWNTETGKREARLDGHVGDVFTARYSPDGTKIVTGGADRTVRIWDSTTFEELGVIKGFGSELIQAKLDWEGRRLLVETIYDMPELVECTPCLDAEELAQRAETHVTRDLTPHELEEAGLAR